MKILGQGEVLRIVGKVEPRREVTESDSKAILGHGEANKVLGTGRVLGQ